MGSLSYEWTVSTRNDVLTVGHGPDEFTVYLDTGADTDYATENIISLLRHHHNKLPLPTGGHIHLEQINPTRARGLMIGRESLLFLEQKLGYQIGRGHTI